jgi:aspartate carbamoyltransferase catalytic subunit
MLKLGHIVESQQFDRETLATIFSTADEMSSSFPQYEGILNNKIMVVLFYEPSTRTRMSFESAMKRLGGQVVGTENAIQFSSRAKGESLEDTATVVSSYGDVIVLRYYKEGGAKRAAQFSGVPVINAGDGTGQHPTQALLDLYTIQKEFEDLRGLKIAMAGDLANGRTVKSLCYLLAKHSPDNEVHFVSPVDVRMSDEIKDFMDKYRLRWYEHSGWGDVINIVDVVYQTRVQKERFKDDPITLERVRNEAEALRIDERIMSRMKEKAILLHPLPRDNDIGYGVDRDPRARYFEQSRNGLFVRMALLKMILIGY